MANRLPPYLPSTADGVEEQTFFRTFVGLMCHKYKESFAAAAEILGMVLAYMEEKQDVRVVCVGVGGGGNVCVCGSGGGGNVCVWGGGGGCVQVWVHWWLSGMHSELPIKGLGVQGQPVVIWCSVFLLAAVAAVTI